MKAIFFMFLIILINLSHEYSSLRIKCQPGEVKLCACIHCICATKPKCPVGQVARCRARPPTRMGCFCEK